MRPDRRAPATPRTAGGRKPAKPGPGAAIPGTVNPGTVNPGAAIAGAANPGAPIPGLRTVAFVSLGCPKNLVDSEKMLGLLAQDGLIPVSDGTPADAIVINTCGFLEASKLESIEEIQQAADLKKSGQVKRLVVAGCLVQRHRAKLLDWCPDIDALIGVFDRDRIVAAVRGTPAPGMGAPTGGNTAPAPAPGMGAPTGGNTAPASGVGASAGSDVPLDLPVYSSIAANATIARRARGVDQSGYFESDAARLRLTPRHYAYLRISEGCNQNCAFCTIPSIRGKMRSKPIDAILAEARELLADGAFELNLIGQDTTSYGADIGYGQGLVGLLTALDRTLQQEGPHAERGSRDSSGGGWLRLMYAYPSCFSDDMIAALADLPNVVKYIDIPLQHISDPVLTAMRRHTSRRLIEKLLEKLRRRAPGIAIRTTFISGYPGETGRQHRELVRFVRDFGFDHMGVFAYSPEPGTPAGTRHASGQAIPEEIVRGRVEELMLTQQEIVFTRHAALARQGARFEVLIDGPGPRPGTYVGRTSQQAPQIDGTTLVASPARLAPGEMIHCRITGHDGYDLQAAPAAPAGRPVSLPVLHE